MADALTPRLLARAGATLTAAIGVILTQLYVLYNQAFDFTTFLIGVVAPLSLGVAAFALAKDRALLFAYLGFFWSFVEDAPVYLDSVHTWPEVTRFNPFLPHLALEILFHLATLGFLLLAARELLGRTRAETPLVVPVYGLTLVSVLLSYGQNLPLEFVQTYVESSWYALDVAEHLASVGVFGFVIAMTTRPARSLGKTQPQWEDGLRRPARRHPNTGSRF